MEGINVIAYYCLTIYELFLIIYNRRYSSVKGIINFGVQMWTVKSCLLKCKRNGIGYAFAVCWYHKSLNSYIMCELYDLTQEFRRILSKQVLIDQYCTIVRSHVRHHPILMSIRLILGDVLLYRIAIKYNSA